jgi:hypothetical protein
MRLMIIAGHDLREELGTVRHPEGEEGKDTFVTPAVGGEPISGHGTSTAASTRPSIQTDANHTNVICGLDALNDLRFEHRQETERICREPATRASSVRVGWKPAAMHLRQ